MQGFLSNSLWFPAISPSINRAHPLARPGHLQLAAVANIAGGMTDLSTGAQSTNSATLNECNELGPCVWGSAVDSSVFLSFANNGPTTVNQTTMAAIFKYISQATSTQWLINYYTNWGIRIITTNVNLTIANGNRITLPLTPGHCYYILAQIVMGGAVWMILYDMTDGILTVASGVTPAAASITGFTILQTNDASTSGKNRMAAAAVMTGTTASPAALSLGEAQGLTNDPWSLWYPGG
jgi:hypothetical protein